MFQTFVFVVALFPFANAVSFAQTPSGNNAPTSTDNQKLVAASTAAASAAQTVKYVEGKVVAVFDGDTLNVESKDRKIYAIRMLGVDAPEDKQTYAENSRKKLANLISGKQVTILVKKKDTYNRHIGVVYYKGKDINLKQIEEGMAWHHAPFAFEQSVEDRRMYAQAEQKARADRLGLWKDDRPLPPWEYASSVKTTNETDNQTKTGEKQSAASAVSKMAEIKKSEAAPNTKTQSDKKYIRGTRGGCYYINSNGNKTYVDRSLCN